MFFATFHDGDESYLAYGPNRDYMAVAVTVGGKFDHELPMRFPACMGEAPRTQTAAASSLPRSPSCGRPTTSLTRSR